MVHLDRSDGFTLIELMITVAVIGLLALIAVPKFAGLVRKSTEGSTQARLGAIRSAITVYHADTDGAFPDDHLECLTTNGKYLSKIPNCDLPPYHVVVNTVSNNSDLGGGSIYTTDTGSWIYFNDSTVPAGDRSLGDVWIGCLHLDSRDIIWSSH